VEAVVVRATLEEVVVRVRELALEAAAVVADQVL
jgi:hypothetical protein